MSDQAGVLVSAYDGDRLYLLVPFPLQSEQVDPGGEPDGIEHGFVFACRMLTAGYAGHLSSQYIVEPKPSDPRLRKYISDA